MKEIYDKILIVDDDKSIRQTLKNLFTRENFVVECAENGAEAIELIQKERPDLIISDMRMPEITGLELLEKVKELDSNIPFIIITAYDEMQSTIEAIQKGALDYIEKPIEIDKIRHTVRKALENKKLSNKLESFSNENNQFNDTKNILIGKTQSMRDVYKIIGQVSINKVLTLIQGESGTGKELVARAIHFSGITKTHPFIPVNCSALTESLLESELFGHVKGAFTGSVRDKKGKFELANEGTIFLDEISEVSPQLQVKLLRVLQEREFERVGGEVTIPLKARILAATNRNLQKLVEQGKFREDLYYRLKVVTIDVPPLRERREDIPVLIDHFLKKINNELHKNVTKISDEVIEILTNHTWIGNVRELENTLMQAIVLSTGDILEKENVLLRKDGNVSSEFDDVTKYTISDVEKMHIDKMLKAVKWDKAKAAKFLGISLPTLYSKIENYKLSDKSS
ncbi:MAG: sigma-54-dependent transcriptional regulator [Rhodothermaceae bacterium]